MSDRPPSFGEPPGPWSALHALGAAVVIVLLLGIAATIWPGWNAIFQWWTG
jgi:hypothetical protein